MAETAYPPPPGTEKRTNGPAIAALITGIVALLLSWLPGINLLSFVLGLVALVTGIIGVRKAGEPFVGGKGQAITGIVTGVLALVVAVLVYVGIASILSDPEFQEQIEQIEQQ